DVAMADLTDIPTTSVKPGTMTTPPPMPSKPERAPATTPTPASCTGDAVTTTGPPLVASAVGGGVRAMRQAVVARSAAVRTMSQWPWPGTACEASEPRTAATTPAGAAQRTTRQSIRPSLT